MFDPHINNRFTISVYIAAENCITAIINGGICLVNRDEWLFWYFIILIPYLISESMWTCRIAAETNLASKIGKLIKEKYILRDLYFLENSIRVRVINITCNVKIKQQFIRFCPASWSDTRYFT